MNTTTTINAPTLFNNMVKETMTSLEIAEIVKREHKSVMRSIRDMEDDWVKVRGCKFALSQRTIAIPNGGYKEVPCYVLNKTECLYIATKFNDETRAKLVLRWEELETKERTGGFVVPQTFSQALMLAAKQQEQIEEQRAALAQQGEEIVKLSNEVMTMKPKATYYDLILNNPSTVTITQIAQDYGMSAKKFNQILCDFRIQHKVNKQWILYADNINKGYVQSKPTNIPLSNGTEKVVYNTEWTQKGRIFLYEKLKRNGILPMIENKELFDQEARQ